MRRSGRNPNRRNTKEPNNSYQGTRTRRGLISPQTKSFAYGVGVGMLAMVLFPQLKDSLKPVAAGAVKGATSIADKIQEVFNGAKESLEDIVAEAKFENMKKSLDHEVKKSSAEEAVEDVAEKVVEGVAEDVIKNVVEDVIL